jgi:hypothetical protein
MDRPSMRGRTKHFTEKQIIAALQECAGVQSDAAKALAAAHGRTCSRSQINQRIAASPRLKAALAEIMEVEKDIAESELRKAYRTGADWAVRFYLSRQARDRGYGDKVEQVGPGGGPMQHVVRVVTPRDVKDMSDQELEDFIRSECAGSGAD